MVLAAAVFLLQTSAWALDQRFIKPADRDKCPVCGMFVAKYPDWTAEVVYRDGSYAVFDGCKDLFKYLLGLKQYASGKAQSDIAAVYVTDYYSLRTVNGRSAFYVTGSDILGPMGRELIPFEQEADAKEFLKDHRGKSVLRYGDITQDVLKTLE